MPLNLFPHYLFGNYIVEIAKLFKFKFLKFQTTPQADVTPLQVYYGTPRAAFRYWYKKFNGQLLLPSLNFFGVDYRRRADKECPNTHLYTSDPRSYDPVSGTVTINKPPMHFDVTYQFSMYNNNNRQRDKMLHKIFQMFPRSGCSLMWYPDRENFPDIYLFMPLLLEENFTDETEVEGLDETETRDVIKTSFNMVSSAVVPYDVLRVPAVRSVFINEFISEEQSNGSQITINQLIGNTTYWHTYYSGGTGINTAGEANVALNNYWFYNRDSYGKIMLSGDVEI